MATGNWGSFDLARVAVPTVVNAVNVVAGVQQLAGYPLVATQVFCSAMHDDDSGFGMRDGVGLPVNLGALAIL